MIQTNELTVTAPGRVGIVGNPSDMYGGSVLSCSTKERACVRITPSDSLLLVSKGQQFVVLNPDDLDLRGDDFDLQRAALRHFGLGPHDFLYRVEVSTEVPERSGMAGSTAIAVALTAALCRMLDKSLQPHIIAEQARGIEAHEMGIVCGYQDQYMAAFGGLRFLDFRGKERLAGDSEEPYATVESLEEFESQPPLIVAHTGVMRNSGTVHSNPRQRWEAGDQEVVAGFTRIAELARLGKKALIHQNWEWLGQLMDENHRIVQSLGMSNSINDSLISAAREAGCYGAKLAGAGKGGTVIALSPSPDETAEALLQMGAKSIYFPMSRPGLQLQEAPLKAL